MPDILLSQGPNMSYLGRRQPELYGRTTAAELDAMLALGFKGIKELIVAQKRALATL